MKIVNIEDFFHPDAGYQINILPKYLVQFGHEVIIITSDMKKIPLSLKNFFQTSNIQDRDREYEYEYKVKIIRLPLIAFVSGRAIFSNELLKTIKQISPDVLFAHGNDTASGMFVLAHKRYLHSRIVMDSHMLEMASQNRFNKLFRVFYKQVFTPIINKNDIPVIRTQDDPFVNKYLGVPERLTPWISYGSDTLLFNPNKEARMKFRRRNGIENDDFVVIYAGKLDKTKGGLFLAEAFRHKFRTNRNVVLIVVGTATEEYGQEVESKLQESENSVIRFPTQKYNDLAEFYQASDLSIFPKQCSLSFYDSQACGLPVLSENNQVNIERCSHNNGWNFKANSVEDFRIMMEHILNLKDSEYQSVSENSFWFIKEYYDYEKKAREYESVIIEQYKRKTAK